jgi:hypothetical protein
MFFQLPTLYVEMQTQQAAQEPSPKQPRMNMMIVNDDDKDQIRQWVLELREIVTPDKYPVKRERAREVVALLNQFRFEPTSIIADEIERLAIIWRRLEKGCRG